MLQEFDRVWLAEAQGRKDAKRSAARGLAILSAYHARYANRESWEPLLVEEPFMVPIGDLIWVGVIDIVARMLDGNQRLLVVDHKTSSSLTPYYWLQYLTGADNQGAGYLHAINKLVGPAEIFCPNVLLVNEKKVEFDRRFFTPDLAAFQKTVLHWHKVMMMHWEANCWPKNGKYCNRWGKCSYATLCEIYPDVAEAELIEGYAIQHWDPVEELKRRN
jgi:hypothetical protein